MGGKRRSTDEPEREQQGVPRLLTRRPLPTESIDLNSLLYSDVTQSGSFDLRAIETSLVGKLLQALPILALLVNRLYTITFSNDTLKDVQGAAPPLAGLTFTSLFTDPSRMEQIRSILETVFETRNPQTAQAVMEIEGIKLFARMHFRSIRLGAEREILVLVEDLTREQKQLNVIKRHSLELRKTHDLLEQRVHERTSKLQQMVLRLRQEASDRRRAEANFNLAANVIKSSNEAIVITDTAADIVDVNDAFSEITGYSKEEVVGKNPRIMASGRHDKQFWAEVWKELEETGQWRGEVWDRRKNGEVFPKLLSISTVLDEQNKLTNYVGIFSDISRMKATERRLVRMAQYDPLTGLSNRVLFRDRVRQALRRADRTRNAVAVMFLDLDGFKTVNDTLGHPVGDELLIAVAERLKSCVRKSDTVARLGGDEFTLLLADFADVRSIDFLARKVVARMRDPFTVVGRKIFVTASIGIALYPEDGDDADDLLQNADTAMYHVKERGKNGFQYFSREMNLKALDRLELETALREALERQEFLLYYQPQVDLHTGRICGSEALIRWNHPNRGLVSPMRFIGVAEETGLIRPLGEWVLRHACEQTRKWLSQGLPPLRVAVNISGRQISGYETVHTIARILEETDMDPSLLDLEVTESTLMEDREEAVQILQGLKRFGVQVSIDDFGTGYSSLSHLKRFPVDKLKIDQSFVRHVTTDQDDEAIVKAIIAVGHSLKLKVMAEGVETPEQLEFLRSQGCDQIQGFYVSGAIPADAFVDFLSQGSWKV